MFFLPSTTSAKTKRSAKMEDDGTSSSSSLSSSTSSAKGSKGGATTGSLIQGASNAGAASGGVSSSGLYSPTYTGFTGSLSGDDDMIVVVKGEEVVSLDDAGVEPLYCICRGPSHGNMVACDDDSCEVR